MNDKLRELHEKLLWLWLAVVLQTITILLILMIATGAFAAMSKIEHAAKAASDVYGVDYNLVMAVIEVESRFNPNAVGKHGEVGLLQLHPKFFPEASFDIVQNVFMGVSYLAELEQKCTRYGKAWLVCYNTGPYSKLQRPAEFPYYQKVMAAYNRRRSNGQI